jgi:hypothetical protein
VLRFHSKWLAYMGSAKSKKKSIMTSCTNTLDSINLEEYKVSDRAFIDLEQPIG